MNTTMKRIHHLSNERQALWRKAGHGGLNSAETRRVQEMTDELYNLWDTHRRELANDNRVQYSNTTQLRAA